MNHYGAHVIPTSFLYTYSYKSDAKNVRYACIVAAVGLKCQNSHSLAQVNVITV